MAAISAMCSRSWAARLVMDRSRDSTARRDRAWQLLVGYLESLDVLKTVDDTSADLEIRRTAALTPHIFQRALTDFPALAEFGLIQMLSHVEFLLLPAH